MKIKKGIRLDPEIIKAIEKVADKENRTFGNMVETILLKYTRRTLHKVGPHYDQRNST